MHKLKELRSLLEKQTVKRVIVVAIHSLIAAVISSILYYYLLNRLFDIVLWRLSISCLIYVLLLIISSSLFNINYLDYLSVIRQNYRR